MAALALGLTIHVLFVLGTGLMQANLFLGMHNDQRETFYTPPMRWFLTGLEAVGVMDGRRHRRHHAHHLHRLDEVRDWVDLSLPGAEWLGCTLWRRQLARYRAGERAMVPGIIKMYLVFLPLQFGTLLGFFWAMAAVSA